MKKSILILLLFPIIIFSQSTNADYEIYSTVINEIIENELEGEIATDKIFIIRKYKEKWERDEIKWIKVEIDSMETNKYGFPGFLLSKSVIEKFYNEPELRNSITGLNENYINHPILEKNLI